MRCSVVSWVSIRLDVYLVRLEAVMKEEVAIGRSRFHGCQR